MGHGARMFGNAALGHMLLCKIGLNCFIPKYNKSFPIVQQPETRQNASSNELEEVAEKKKKKKKKKSKSNSEVEKLKNKSIIVQEPPRIKVQFC